MGESIQNPRNRRPKIQQQETKRSRGGMQMETVPQRRNDQRKYEQRIQEIVEKHHLEMYFKNKTHATSTCRVGENAKEHWGHRLDTKTHATAVEVWVNKHGNKNVPMENNSTLVPPGATSRE
jgi:hypothetical protein